MLRFKAYFREGVHESAIETERVRQCLVYFFLEDESAAVVEPRQPNSGMSQGTIIKRHKVVKDGHVPLAVSDLGLGRDVHIYGKVFRIYDCDAFTRSYYEHIGTPLGEAETCPENSIAKPGAKHRPEKLSSGKTAAAGGSSATREEVNQTTQFLMHDRKVLRFKSYWDEMSNNGPERRMFNLYYFLSDDCFEVIEVLHSNSGRDPFPSFVRRRKCPKQQQIASLTFAKDQQENYTHADLFLGQELVICGKKFLLCDCDTFTRDFLAEKHGRSGEELRARDCAVPKKALPKHRTPPHNGFGDEDDSLRSCKRLTAQCPVKDVRQYIDASQDVLKFSLERISSAKQIDGLRRFVLTYFLSDSTLSIFEASGRNSGILGGKFLQRQKVKFKDGTPAQPQHFFVGATVNISHCDFKVVSTDERSLAYMENHTTLFKKSCVNTVMAKVRALLASSQCGLRSWLLSSPDDDFTYDTLLQAVSDLDLPLVEQEVLTVARYLANQGAVTNLLFFERAGGGVEVDEGWEALFGDWAKELKEGEVSTEQEMDRSREMADGRASQGMLKVMHAYNIRRHLFQQVMRTACDTTRDGRIGATEFLALVHKLEILITPEQAAEMQARLFPVSLPRVSYREMIKLLEHTSSYEHTSKAIGRIR